MADIDPTFVVQRYRAAYEASNGKAAPAVDYKCGWYVFQSDVRGIPPQRYRKNQVLNMTDNLSYRAKQKD